MIVTINSKNNIVNCVRGVLMQVLQVQIKPSLLRKAWNSTNTIRPNLEQLEENYFIMHGQVK